MIGHLVLLRIPLIVICLLQLFENQNPDQDPPNGSAAVHFNSWLQLYLDYEEPHRLVISIDVYGQRIVVSFYSFAAAKLLVLVAKLVIAAKLLVALYELFAKLKELDAAKILTTAKISVAFVWKLLRASANMLFFAAKLLVLVSTLFGFYELYANLNELDAAKILTTNKLLVDVAKIFATLKELFATLKELFAFLKELFVTANEEKHGAAANDSNDCVAANDSNDCVAANDRAARR